MSVAGVGTGIYGLGLAYALSRQHDVTLYEAAAAVPGIRFAADARVVYHRDYWDAAEAV